MQERPMKLKKPQDSLKRQDKNWIKKFSPMNRGNKVNNSVSLFKVQTASYVVGKELDQSRNQYKAEDLNGSKTE